MPKSVESFNGLNGIIKVFKNSCADEYAKSKNIEVQYLADEIPKQPTIKSVETDQSKNLISIVVEADNYDPYEYSIYLINWQKDKVIKAKFEPNKEYKIYQRIYKTVDFNESYPSEPTIIKTNPCGVKPEAPILSKVTSTSVSLIESENFEYKMDDGEWQSSNVFTELAPNSTHKFYQRVAETDTAYASEPSEALTVTTLKNTVNSPSVPELKGKTVNSVTLKDVDGYEYRMNDGEWQKSNVFTGLNDDTEYTFYQRIAETETSYASESSLPLKVKTEKIHTPDDITGHEWSEWTETKPASCTVNGEEQRSCLECGSIETKILNSLGHDLKHTDAKAATCTESGYAAYDTCQREGCGYTTYEEIPAFGHKKGEAVTENRTKPACTKAGSYDSVVYCDVCKAGLSRETKIIPALGHTYGEATVTAPEYGKEGYSEHKCTVCGYEEKFDFTEALKYPMGQTLVFEDGIWKYVSDGKLAPEYTGLVEYYGTWYYVEGGILNWSYTGLTNFYGTWYYVDGGILNWGYTGLTNFYGTWYYVEGGILNWGYTGLTNYYGTWYYVEGGILNWGYTGLTNFYGTWYYVDGGILNWGYTGLTNYYGTWYYVANGVLDWNYTGSTYYYGTWYYVQGGVLR